MNPLVGVALFGMLAGPMNVERIGESSLVSVDRPSPGTVAALLDRDVMVVRDLDRFLLAVAERNDLRALDDLGLSWEVLDPTIGDKTYYTVLVPDAARLPEVREQARVLRYDGWEAVIEAPPADAEKLAEVGLEIARVFMRPVRPAPEDKAVLRAPLLQADSLVQAVVDSVSSAAIDAHVQRLQDFVTRYSQHDSCQAAADYIKAEFESYGIDSVYFHTFSGTYKPNVVAVIPGRAFPDQMVVVGGHYDSVTSNHENCPGADDDASGTACVLECARVLSAHDFNYTLVFIAYCAEEQGLIGSEAWAAQAAANGDVIIGSIAVDMIGYVAGGDTRDIDVIDNAGSQWLRDLAVDVGNTYVPSLPVVDGSLPGGASSDHASFWAHGYDAILFFEDTGAYSPYIHTANDVVGVSYVDPLLAEGSVKITAGMLATLAEPFGVAIAHTPLPNTTDTGSPYRVVADVISAGPLDTDSLLVHFTTPSGSSTATMTATGGSNEYEGWIPAQPGGTWVSYYLSAADQAGHSAVDPSGAPTETHTFFVGTITAAHTDDFETNQGWTVGAAHDSASTGVWERGNPNGTDDGGSIQVQPEDDHTPTPGVQCYVTGNDVGASHGSDDVDGGKTTLVSPVYDLSNHQNATVRYYRWYTNDTGGNPDTDEFMVDASSNGGSSWVRIETLDSSDRNWTLVEKDLDAFITLTSQVQFRFIAEDDASGSIVEAGVDDFSIVVYQSPPTDVTVSTGRDGLLLAQNYPNPFRSRTAIQFAVPSAGRMVTLGVYDVTGRRVAELLAGEPMAGPSQVMWDGRDDGGSRVAAGVYFYRLKTGDEELSRKLMILR